MSKMAIKSKNSCAICSIKNVTFYKLDDEVLGKNVALLMAGICEAEVANIGTIASTAQFCQSCVLAVIQAESVIAKVRNIFQATTKLTKKVASATQPAAPAASPKVAKKATTTTTEPSTPAKTNGVEPATDVEPAAAAMQQLVKGKYVFQCEQCEWRTILPKLYMKHQQWKHGIETKRIYGCQHCKESYVHLHFLIAHMAKKHGVGEPVDGTTALEDDERAGAKTPEPKKPQKRPVAEVANGEAVTAAATKKPKLSESVATKKTPKKAAAAAAITTSTPLSVFKKTSDESPSAEQPKKASAQLKKAALFKKTGDELASLEVNNESAVKKPKLPFPYACTECEFTTKLPKRLMAHHVASHDATNMRIFKCPQCKEVYQRAGALQNHHNLQHMGGEKPAKKASETAKKASETAKKATETSAAKSKAEASPKKAVKAPPASVPAPPSPVPAPPAPVPAPAPDDDDEKFTYQCTECQYTATSQKLFKKHRETKHQADEQHIFQCGFCKEAFKRGINLQKHLLQKHAGQPAEPVNEKATPKKKAATPKKATPKQTAGTPAVKFPKFSDPPTVIESDADDVTIVEDSTSGKKVLYDCATCPYVTHSKKKFAKHMAQSHGAQAAAAETTFVPMMNSSAAAPKRKLSLDSDSSKRPASKLKRVACNQCDKTFKTVARLHTHIESDHMGGDVYTCPYCAKSYKSRPKYEEHIFKEACRNKKHSCSVIGCGKRFATEKDLAYHTATKHLEESMKVIDYEEEHDESDEDDE